MQLSSMSSGGILVLTVNADRIDAASAIHLKDQFREQVADSTGRVVMDLGQVDFMDSSGLGAIVAALKLLDGRKLELAAPTPAVKKVFTLTRMDKIFTLHPDLETALTGGSGTEDNATDAA
ncbi:MAG: STAS domain-containing protein [Paracoccaceae bacterium]